MTELLALHPKTKVDMLLTSVPRPASGVPINALPGWAEVPLYAKLPMLKCPTNQIIFSREKVGKKLWQAGEFRLYDPYCYVVRMNYDSLHDPHLKPFYSKENNLRRLRKIGKITKQNDVICTLKDFNGYRRLLQRYYLDLIHKEIKRRESEQRDRALLFHAQNIAEQECQKFSKLQRFKRDLDKTTRYKSEAERMRQERFRAILENLKKRSERIAKLKLLKKRMLAEKTKLHNIQIMQRQNLANDMERKRIILLKKRFALRDVRLNTRVKRQRIEKVHTAKQKAIKAWEKRLELRTEQHERTMKLLQEAEDQKQRNIQKRKLKLERKWRQIKAAIARRSKKKKISRERKNSIRRSVGGEEMHSPESSFYIKHLPRKDIHGIVNVALDLEENEYKNFEFLKKLPDAVIKTANHILHVVIKNFNKDLSKDPHTMRLLEERINSLFDTIKKDMIGKVSTLIKNNDRTCLPSKCSKGGQHESIMWGKGYAYHNLPRFVSFGNSTNIGRTTQDLERNVRIRKTRTRTPTPAGSLTSVAPVVIELDTTAEEQSMVQRKSVFAYCEKDERIFIEHFYIKFKRALTVSISRRVFNALRCYMAHQILNPRKELLDIDRSYLTNVMAKSILTYNINSYNFYSNSRLCVSAVSADIIWELQKTLLRPTRDPRFLAKPKCRCGYTCAGDKCYVLNNAVNC